MKGSSTLFLKALVILIGIFVFAFFALVIPDEVDFANTGMFLPFLLVMYASTIPFYFALYQTFMLLNYVDAGTAFSSLSVKALHYIKYSAIVFGLLYGACLPLLFQVAQSEDAPGVGAIGLILTLSPVVIATFAAVLQRILHDALKLKSENDLTV